MPRIYDALETYREVLSADGLASGSIKAATTAVRQLAAILDDIPIAAIEPSHLVLWQSAVSKSGISLTTHHHRARHIRTFFTWCTDVGYCRPNPASKLVIPKRPKRLPDVLTESEMRRLQLDYGL